jgi:Phage terminase large subunit (GpA)
MVAGGRWVATWVPDDAQPVPAVIPAGSIDDYAILPCSGRVAGREPGYAIWSAYSPMESWSDIWERGQAARADPAMLKVFMQQDLGEPYEPRNDTPDWEKLLGARKPWKRGVAPWPASVLTGARALAWGEGAGQLTASDWRERAAEAHGALDKPTLFSAPPVAPGTPAEAWPPATQRDEIDQVIAAAAKLKAAAEAGGESAGERKIRWAP